MTSRQPEHNEALEKVAERLTPIRGNDISADSMGRQRLMADGSGDEEGTPDMRRAENSGQDVQGDGGAYGEFGQTEPAQDDSGFDIDITRRHLLYGGATLAAGAAASQLGGNGNKSDQNAGVTGPSGESAPTAGNSTQDGGKPTEEERTTEEPVEPDRSFSEIYNGSVPRDTAYSLSEGQIAQVKETERQEGISHALEEANEMLMNARDPVRGFKGFVRNELGYSEDQVRVFEREQSDGTPYGAVMVKNEDGDWVKNLLGQSGFEDGFLRFDEDSLDSNIERGLNDIWRQDGEVESATAYEQVKSWILSFGSSEEVGEEQWSKVGETYSKRNDHIVVGDDADVGEVCYTKAGARAVANIQDFDDHDVFNKEMEMVENVTEFYHNELGEGYVQVDATTGTLGEDQVELTELDSGETLYAEEVGEEEYDEAILSLYDEE